MEDKSLQVYLSLESILFVEFLEILWDTQKDLQKRVPDQISFHPRLSRIGKSIHDERINMNKESKAVYVISPYDLVNQNPLLHAHTIYVFEFYWVITVRE